MIFLLDDAAADQYAAIRRHLESAGQILGALDVQIAAIALASGCTNTAEFSRVPGLVLDDWQLP